MKTLSKKQLYLLIAGLILCVWIAKKIYSRTPEPDTSRQAKQSALEQTAKSPVPQDEAQQESVIPVRVLSLKKKTFREQIPVQGTINGTKVQLRFEMAGSVCKLYLEPGAHVSKGEILAELDFEDTGLKIQYREAKKEAARMQLAEAENKLKMYQDLFKTGYLLAAKLEEVRLEKENKQQEYEAACLEVASAEREGEKAKLVAPCDGVIAEKETAIGEYLPSGTRVGSMMDDNDLYLELNITERYYGKVLPDQKVKFSSSSYPGKEFKGTVVSVVPVVEGKSRTMTTKVKLASEQLGKGKKLIPGMYVSGWISLCDIPDALVVPMNCVRSVGADSMVPVVDAENKVRLHRVQVEYSTVDQAIIRAGLEEGERVAVEFPRPLRDGDLVRAVE